ncbi:hypothetical protein LX36DRAFT_302871 [Colletotrichum falcatum]|nr:hypothetical protein LX36DRAFT_302871 [Colletotrichum falcatum]
MRACNHRRFSFPYKNPIPLWLYPSSAANLLSLLSTPLAGNEHLQHFPPPVRFLHTRPVHLLLLLATASHHTRPLTSASPLLLLFLALAPDLARLRNPGTD